jgi:hypothetical protein
MLCMWLVSVVRISMSVMTMRLRVAGSPIAVPIAAVGVLPVLPGWRMRVCGETQGGEDRDVGHGRRMVFTAGRMFPPLSSRLARPFTVLSSASLVVGGNYSPMKGDSSPKGVAEEGQEGDGAVMFACGCP